MSSPAALEAPASVPVVPKPSRKRKETPAAPAAASTPLTGTLERLDLSRAAKTAGEARAGRTTLPILSGMLLRAEQGVLTLICTDNQIEVQCDLPWTGTDGACVIGSADRFLQVCQNLGGTTATLVFNEDRARLYLSCGESKYEFSTAPNREGLSSVEQWPPMGPEPETASRITVNGPAFKSALTRVLRVPEGTQGADSPHCYSVECRIDGRRLILTALNAGNTRCVRTAVDLINLHRVPEAETCLLPRRLGDTGLAERLVRTLPDAEALEVLISYSEMRFAAPGYRSTSRLVDGKMPDINKPLSAPVGCTATLPRELFSERLRRLQPFTDKDAPGVSLEITAAGVRLVAESEYGRGEERLDCASEGTADCRCRLNYLEDAITCVDGEELRLETLQDKDGVRMLVFRSVDGPEGLYCCAVLRK